MRKVIWSAFVTEEQAKYLADFVNQGLSDKDKIEIIILVDGMFAYIGTETTRTWFNDLMKEMEKSKQK